MFRALPDTPQLLQQPGQGAVSGEHLDDDGLHHYRVRRGFPVYTDPRESRLRPNDTDRIPGGVQVPLGRQKLYLLAQEPVPRLERSQAFGDSTAAGVTVGIGPPTLVTKLIRVAQNFPGPP